MITLTRKEAHHLLVALQELNRLSIGENAIFLPAEIDDAMELLEARLSAPEPESTKLLLIPALMEQAGWVRKREWQGLTDEEIAVIDKSIDVNIPLEQGKLEFARAIEAKLKEKNNG